MSNSRFWYEIRGCRYAPELFRAYKGLQGQKKMEMPLTSDQRSQLGNICLTQGGKAGVAFLKHIEREKEHRCHQYMTYGFMLKEEPRRYVYCADLLCRERDPLAVRLHTLRSFRQHLARDEGRIEQSTECELDGYYCPANVRKNYVAADLKRPIVIWLRVE